MAKSLVSCFFLTHGVVSSTAAAGDAVVRVITVACPPAARVRLKVCSQRMNVTEVD